LRGALFESLIIIEAFKYNYNHNESPQVYFWRDMQGHEIDCIIEKNFMTLIPIEIKSSKTFSSHFFDGLADWEKITKQENVQPYVVYGGTTSIKREKGHVFAWNDLARMLKLIYD